MKVYVLCRDHEEWCEGIYATLEAAMRGVYEGEWTGPITHKRYAVGDTTIVEGHAPRWDFQSGEYSIHEEEVQGG